jgi:hypothetical protein
MQPATYTYLRRADATAHTIPCADLWQALKRVKLDVEQNTEEIRPVSITTDRACFDYAQILALLRVYTNPQIIRWE